MGAVYGGNYRGYRLRYNRVISVVLPSKQTTTKLSRMESLAENRQRRLCAKQGPQALSPLSPLSTSATMSNLTVRVEGIIRTILLLLL